MALQVINRGQPSPNSFQNAVREDVKSKLGRSTSSWGTVGVDNVVKADKEEKQRQKKNAQLMLHTWEMVEQNERREKESKLKEKVILQQQLIKKCGKYLEEKKMAETQWHIKKRQQEAKKRKAIAASIVQKAAIKAPPTKKGIDKVAPPKPGKELKENFSTYKKADDMFTASGDKLGSNEGRVNESSCRVPNNADEDTKPSIVTADTNGDMKKQLSLCSKLGGDELLFRKPENKIAKFIGLDVKDHVKMDELWAGLKAHSDRQLKPLSHHVNKLKNISVPSTKECLEEYEKPISMDYYTGKPVPLSTLLTGKRKVKPPRDYYVVRNTRSIANDRSSFGTITVDKLRNVFNTDEMEDSSNWFTFTHKDMPSTSPSLRTPSPLLQQSSSGGGGGTTNDNILEDIESLQFLTDDGRILGQSKPRSQLTTGGATDKTDYKPSSVVGSGCGHNDESTVRAVNSGGSVGGGRRSPCSRSSSTCSVWEPLSIAALGEYHGVKQRKVTGHGNFSHGCTKVWKPLS